MKKKWTIATVLLLQWHCWRSVRGRTFRPSARRTTSSRWARSSSRCTTRTVTAIRFTTVRVMPGSVVNKVVYVENVGTGAFYTRVKITPEILNADSERMPLDPSEHLLVLDLNDTDWSPDQTVLLL